MKNKMGFRWIVVCLGLALLAPFLTSQVQAQQGEKKVTQKNSGPGQSVPATTSDGQSNEPIVFPIVGKGTTNFLPVFTGATRVGNSLVSQTGNGITVNGTVGAVSFSGDGSGLSNVNASTLGGVNSSAFAQTGASNNFTGDQTITGNLNLTGYINSAFSLQGNLTDQNGQEGGRKYRHGRIQLRCRLRR